MILLVVQSLPQSPIRGGHWLQNGHRMAAGITCLQERERLACIRNLAPERGFEPRTLRLTDRCSPFGNRGLNSLSATACRRVSPFIAGVTVRNDFWLTGGADQLSERQDTTVLNQRGRFTEGSSRKDTHIRTCMEHPARPTVGPPLSSKAGIRF